jgi:hypothetical protein
VSIWQTPLGDPFGYQRPKFVLDFVKHQAQKGVVMSIYDDSFSEDPKKTPQKPADQVRPEQLAAPPPTPVGGGMAADDPQEPDSPRRRGCGCRSCLLVFLAIGLISVTICGIGGYLGFKRAPGWAHDAIVAAVNDSDLDAKTKEEITGEMDRLLEEYIAGNVPSDQFIEALEELGNSPVLVLILAYAAMESYVEPSGLSDDEKADAKIAFQRVARGTFEDLIDPDDLEEALDFISKKDFNGNRQLKSRVSDEDLRALVRECNRVADDAEIPNERYQVDVAAEVKRIVDRAVGIIPDDVPEVDGVDSPPSKEAATTNDQAESLSEAAAVPAVGAVED